MKIKGFTSASAIVLGLAFGSVSVSAAFIDGSISFSDGFSTSPTVVSTTTFFDINSASTNATSTTGDFGVFIFAPPQVLVSSAGDIDKISPGGTLYDVGGFTFTLGSITQDTNLALNCFGGACVDSRTLRIAGTVSGNGFDPTLFIGLWTANGSCLGANELCSAAYSSTWSSSITATGQLSEVPLPAAGWLFISALGGLVVAKRKQLQA